MCPGAASANHSSECTVGFHGLFSRCYCNRVSEIQCCSLLKFSLVRVCVGNASDLFIRRNEWLSSFKVLLILLFARDSDSAVWVEVKAGGF